MNQYQLSRRFNICDRVKVSFEFFPPKSDDMKAQLWETIKRLEPLNPKFVSVIYGAGGTTRERTARMVRRLLEEPTLTPVAHMTSVDVSCKEVD